MASPTSIDGTPGDDVLTGTAADETLTGGEGNDTMSGQGGNDYLAGGPGDDSMDGGTGNDTFYVDAQGDRVHELAGEGYDRIAAMVSYMLAADAEVELIEAVNLTATDPIDLGGSDYANTIHGNAGANVLYGGGGNDQLHGDDGNDASYGGAGDDILYGGAGDDILDGEDGADVMVGGIGNDTYYVDLVPYHDNLLVRDYPGDRIYEQAGEGYDTVYVNLIGRGPQAFYTNPFFALDANAEIEVLAAGNPASYIGIGLVGNGFSQTIYGTEGNYEPLGRGGDDLRGGGGDDVLYGLGGRDVLRGDDGNDILVGGLGNDTMYGGTGDDTYYVDSSGDLVIEAEGEGADRIATSASFELTGGASVEILEAVNLTGTEAINLTGSDFANTIIGNAGANVINGRGGSDFLVGLGGADTFQFTTALSPGNIDRIEDFQAGLDKIALDHAIFQAFNPGSLDPACFRVGDQAVDSDDRIIYDAATGALLFDADGSGPGSAVHFATLQAGLALTAADFIVI